VLLGLAKLVNFSFDKLLRAPQNMLEGFLGEAREKE
jgi:hypothetical protein